MAEIYVRQFNNPELQMNELDKCLKRLKKDLEKDGTLKIIKEKQFYKKPSTVRREKEKMVRSLMERRRKKKQQWDDKYGDIKFVKRPQQESTESHS